MGGKRQSNILSSIINNFQTVEDVIQSSAASSGSALKENEVYLDSMQGRIDKLTNSMQSMWVNAMDSTILKGLISIVDVLVQIVDKAGLANVAIAALMGKIAFNSKHFGVLNWFNNKKNGKTTMSATAVQDTEESKAQDADTAATERNTAATNANIEAEQRSAQTSAQSAAADAKEAQAATQVAQAETAEVSSSNAEAAADSAEAVSSTAAAAADSAEAASSTMAASADAIEVSSSAASAAADIAETQASEQAMAADAAEAVASTAAATADTAEAVGSAAAGAASGMNALAGGLVAGTTAFKLFNAAATMGLSLLVGAAIAGIGKLINAEKEAKAAANEAVKVSQNLRQQAESLDGYKQQITELRSALDSNNLSESEAYDARQKLLTIQDELISKFGLEKDGINLVTGAINDQIAVIDELSQKNAQQWLNNNQKSINSAIDYFESDSKGSNLDTWGTETTITNWTPTKNVANMIEEYANNREHINTFGNGMLGQDINFKGSVEEVKAEVEDFQAWLADKEDEMQTQLTNLTSLPQNEQTDGIKNQIRSLEKDIEQIQDVREDLGTEYENWFGTDSTYAANKALMDEVKQQTALAKYADEYYNIVEAQNAFIEAQAKGDQKGMKEALGDLKVATEEVMDVASENYMYEFFSDLGNEFDVQEFELNVKLDENDLKTNLQSIIAEGGENGLSALDDNAIKAMVKEGLNVEGATDASGKYTEEQISGLIALQAEADKAGISIETLIKILTNLGLIAGRPAEAATEGIRAVGQAYSTLATSAEKYKDINEVLNELAYDNIEISEEQYDVLKELIGSEEEFADCIDTSNGYIVKNTALTKKLVDQKKKEQAADVKLAKSQARLEYYKLVKQLNNTLDGTKKLDSATRESISSTLSQIGAVEQAIYKYQLLEDSLLGVTNAFDAFGKAQEIDSLNTYGDSYVEMAQTIYDAYYQTGQVGTEAVRSAVEAIIDPGVYEGLERGSDEYNQAIFDAFNETVLPTLTLDGDSLSFDFANIENFVNDNLGKLFTGTSIKDFSLVDGMDLDRAVELTGYTKTQLYSMFAELKKYTGVDYFSQLDSSLEGRIVNTTTQLEDLNRQKLALLEDGGYDKNKEAIDEINQKLAVSGDNLDKLSQEAYATWQSYTQNDAVLAALSEVEDKTAFLTEEGALSFGLEWNEVKGQTVQQALDNLLAKQLELGEPTILTAQLAIDNIDNQIAELKTSINSNDFSNIDPIALGLKIDATPEEIKAAIESKIAGLKEDKAVISTTFGIELSEEEKLELENELNAIEVFTIHDKEFSVIANGVSETNKALDSVKDTLREIKDKSITLTTYDTTYKSTKKYNPQTKAWEYSSANGTAHAHGTANQSGSWGAPKTETALVGELGPELLVRGNRWTTVGDNGAEFTQVKKGDIIFNHKQTEQLLKNGYVTGRGKLQGGSALASGTAYSMALWPAEGGSGGGSGKGSGSSSADDAKDQFEELFDWIEVRLEEINEDINLKSAKLENAVGSSKQNAIIDDMISLNQKLYDNLIAGANEYYSYAKTLLEKVPEEYREAAQDGSIAIEKFVGEVDEETLNAIKDYREWVQKGADVTQQAEEVLTEISNLAKQAIDNIANEYENKGSIPGIKLDQLKAYNALLETDLGAESASIYRAMIKANNESIKILEQQRDKMQAELNEQVEAGNIKKYSQDWYDAVNDIAAVDTEIIELTTDTENYQDAINELHWDRFDNLMSRLEAVSDESKNLIDILGSKDLVDSDTGEWTDEGITSLGLYAQQMEVAEIQAKKYKEEINYLNKNWKKLGYTEQEYVEKLEELKEGQYEAIQSYNDAKDAIVDLNKERIDAIKNGIEKEIDAYEELIDKKKEALDAEKDLYDFQKSVQEKEKDIAKIERQLAALAADNSASARAKRAQLEAELAEAQADLQETYYDRSISDQQDALDKELEAFQEEKNAEIESWDEYLENTELVVSDSLATIQANTDVVYQTLQAMGKEYSLSIAEAITSPWSDGSAAIQDYSEQFGLAMSSTVEELRNLANEYKKVMAEIENAGKEAVDQVNDNIKTYNNVNTQQPSNDDEKEKPKTIKVGGKINAGSAKIYDYAGDKTGEKQYYSKDPIYQVLAIDGNWVQVRYHKLAKGITGWFKKSDVKAYAKGTKGVDEDQLALIDELGEELVMHAGPDGKLAFLSKGSAVIPHDISENLMQLGELNPQNMLDGNRPAISAPHITNNNIELNVSFGEVVHIDTVSNDTVPNLAKTVEKQIDKYMKGLNAEIRKYTR